MPAAAAPPRRQRLGSLNNSTLKGPRGKQAAQAQQAAAQRPTAKKHTCCDEPKVEDDGEGHMVCRNCYTQISESNIVADVTFQEDSRGAATVQGGFIGENARHAKTLGSAINRATGGGEKNTQEQTASHARKYMNQYIDHLSIPQSVQNQATQLFLLASSHRFAAGRRTDEVVAACCYAACRRQKDNTVMLIDIAERIGVNVFRLGEVYKDMCKDLYLDEGGVGTQYLVEVESLVMKYCRKLEFGNATRHVAEDAVKIVRRMKRDWMVTGRHPAGLCGACIILAARMNNFRRSIREVVYVSKVADMTIKKRVDEFRRTKAAGLTVSQFRQYGVRLKDTNDPPILYESELKKQKFENLKRKRQEANASREASQAAASEERDFVNIPDDETNASSREASVAASTPALTQDEEGQPARKRQRTASGQAATPPATQQEPRRDADGFLIPALPADIAEIIEEEEEEEAPKRRRKTPPKPIVITEEELVDEAQLEEEIEFTLNDEEVIDSRNEIEKAKSDERAKVLADQQKQAEAESNKARREAAGITWWDGKDGGAREEYTAQDLEDEFEDDPEVANCMLSEAEQKIKERIWVLNNEDWMRQQQEKKMMDAVIKSTGRNDKGKKKGAKPGSKRKKTSRMGDGTTLAEATTPIETPGDANALMVEKRAPAVSRYLNYQTLAKLYEKSPSTSASASRRGSISRPGSASAASRTPSTTPGPPTEEATAGAAPTPDRTQRASATPQPSTQRPQNNDEVDDDDDMEGDEDDYHQPYGREELDYGSDDDEMPVYGDEDDREDIGEDDYNSAVGRLGGTVNDDGDFMDEEY